MSDPSKINAGASAATTEAEVREAIRHACADLLADDDMPVDYQDVCDV